MAHFLFLGLPGGSEWFVILLIALLLFSKRLPDVARSMANLIASTRSSTMIMGFSRSSLNPM